MGWGRGPNVALNKAIWAHQRAQEQAAKILETEHGTKHKPGERADLCPLCKPRSR